MMYLFNVFTVLLLFQITTAFYTTIPTIDRTRDISDACADQMEAYVRGLFGNQSWAWNIFDASPKLPYGILTGNLMEAGNYDQCLRARYDGEGGPILGKFCMYAIGVLIPVYLTMDDQLETRKQRWLTDSADTSYSFRSGLPMQPEHSNRTLLLSICVPDACMPAEILEYLDLPDLPMAALDETRCETVEDIKEFTGADLAFTIFIGFIILLVIICTVYDELIRNKNVPVNPLFISFSITTNFRKVVEDTDNPNRIGCLDGLRVFSILWVILGHRYSIAVAVPYVNSDALEEWKPHTYTQFAQGASSAVDTFMFLTGLLMAMSMIRSMSKPKAKFNIFLYYIHRYIRLTPAMAVVYFMHVSIFDNLASGPYWAYLTGRTTTNCLNRWASFFFYYQNYLDHTKMCLMHTWYLSMDMQIFILSPFILLPLVKFNKFMMKIGMPVLLILTIICPFVITYVYETQIFTDEYYMYYYYPTHTRLSTWLVGVYAGAWIHKYRNAKLEIHPLLNAFLWAVVVVGMVACIFSGNHITYNYDRLTTSFYLALYRPAWCVGLAWVVFACMKGRGGIFDFVLSANVFQTLSKVTYSIYLVHASCLLLNVAKIRYPLHFSDFDQIHLFLGDILTAVTVGVIWYVLFESPVMAIEKVIFGGGGKRPPVEKGEKEIEQNGASEVKIEKL